LDADSYFKIVFAAIRILQKQVKYISAQVVLIGAACSICYKRAAAEMIGVVENVINIYSGILHVVKLDKVFGK
jgi:hypothetical protein